MTVVVQQGDIRLLSGDSVAGVGSGDGKVELSEIETRVLSERLHRRLPMLLVRSLLLLVMLLFLVSLEL